MKYLIGFAVLTIVYLCLIIIAFAPTLYMVWIFILDRKIKLNQPRIRRHLIVTGCVNLALVVGIYSLAMYYVLPSKVAELDTTVQCALKSALAAENAYFQLHGKYYAFGPVRGPYTDAHGVTVDENVIIQVEPHWESNTGHPTFEAHALNVWGQNVFGARPSGKEPEVIADPELRAGIRSKLINSVK
jgi:hypothetical protein